MIQMASRRPNGKVANSVVAMGSAAVMAVYSAGFVRTRPAADRLAAAAIERRIDREIPEEGPPPPLPAAPPAAKIQPAPKAIATVKPPKPSSPSAPSSTPDQPAPEVASLPSGPPPELPAPAIAPPVAAPAVPEKPAEPAPAPPAPSAPAPVVLRDGKYQGWGGCRHGDIQATVVIEGGRIASAEISDCQTRYPCDVIGVLPGQVVMKQTANVRRIAGATESSDAFYWAVVEALKQAK
jgi:uncharacterized protein with FMN-binding domain